MSKEEVYVRILGNRYLLDASVIHIYKNILKWKFLLITKRVIFFHYIDPLVKLQMNLTHSLTIRRNLTIDISSRKTDFVLMIGDFNGKSCNCSFNETTASEGAHLDPVASLY